MKRYLLLALSLLMILSLVACNEDPWITTTNPDTTAPEETTTLPDETSSEPDPAETTEPEVTEPEVTEPEVTEPEVTEPEATEPEATEPEATEPTTPDEPIDPSVFDEVKETVYVINTDALNIRVSPSADSEILATMKEGESVVRTGYNAEWSRISYNGTICYAASKYLTTTAPLEFTNQVETVYITVTRLNLRAKASPESTIVYTLDFGTALERTGVSTTTDSEGNEWSRLLYNGTVCYANSVYLSTTPSASAALAFEDKNDVVYTTAETAVNLREDASSTATILASLGFGTKLERIAVATTEDADGILWSHVKCGDKVGYISTAYLTTDAPISFEDADETLYVTADSLNVRATPAYGSSVLCSIDKDTQVHCIAKATAPDADEITWFKIEINGVVGYASGRYLAAEKAE